MLAKLVAAMCQTAYDVYKALSGGWCGRKETLGRSGCVSSEETGLEIGWVVRKGGAVLNDKRERKRNTPLRRSPRHAFHESERPGQPCWEAAGFQRQPSDIVCWSHPQWVSKGLEKEFRV